MALRKCSVQHLFLFLSCGTPGKVGVLAKRIGTVEESGKAHTDRLTSLEASIKSAIDSVSKQAALVASVQEVRSPAVHSLYTLSYIMLYLADLCMSMRARVCVYVLHMCVGSVCEEGHAI